jgi:hypothetical protein
MVAAAAVLMLRRQLVWLLLPGICTAALLISLLLSVHSVGGNTSNGLAEAFAAGVELEYGWAVLLVGAAALIGAAVIASRTGMGSIRTPTWVAVGTAAALTFVVWVLPQSLGGLGHWDTATAANLLLRVG